MSVAVRIFPEQDEGTVSQVLRRVSGSYETVRENHHKFSELHEAIMQMEQFILSAPQDGTKTNTVLDGISPEMLARTNDAYRFWQTGLEDQFAQRFVKPRRIIIVRLPVKPFPCFFSLVTYLNTNLF